MTKTGAFVLGLVAGGAVVAIVKTPAFRKACAKVVGAGMMLKEDAAAFTETLKEDAEDIVAESRYQRANKETAEQKAAKPVAAKA